MPYIENKNKNNINNFNRVEIKAPGIDDGFFLLSDAAKKCSYTQEYLSLLARKGELKAEKIGRNWYTKMDWLREYVEAHPAQRKGNVKGEILTDRKYKKQIEQSLLVEPIDKYSYKLKELLVDGMERFLGRIKIRFNKAVAGVLAVFVFPKKFFSKSKSGETELENNPEMLLVHEMMDIVLRKSTEELSDVIEKIIPGFRLKKIKQKNNYPFGSGANKFILEAAEEIIMAMVAKVKFNILSWAFGLVQNKVVQTWYQVRVAVKDFVKAPGVLIRYPKAVSAGYRIRVMATTAAAVIFVAVTSISYLNYNLASETYDKTSLAVKAGMKQVRTQGEQAIKLADRFRQIKVDNYTKQEMTKKTVVAGISTVDLGNLVFTKALDGLGNVNMATENIAKKNLTGIGEEKIYLPQTDENDFRQAVFEVTKRASGIKSIVLTASLELGGDQAKEKVKFEPLAKTFVGLRNDLARIMSDRDSYLSKNSGIWFERTAKILTNNFLQITVDSSSRKASDLVIDASKNSQSIKVAFRDYIGSSAEVEEKLMEEKMGKLARLGGMIKTGITETGERWDILTEKLDKLFGRTKNSLGESYLALLDALNLQTKYTNYGTDRTLIGTGDEPLELIKGPAGLEQQGLAVVPLRKNTADERQKMADSIRNTFSDEVEVVPDEDTATGIIRPKDKEQPLEDYMYVFVPIAKEKVNE